MASSAIRFKLYENYISQPKENIYRFIIGKTILQQKYYSILNNANTINNSSKSNTNKCMIANNNSFIFDFILILSSIICGIILSILLLVQEYHQRILITDTIIISFQVLTLSISFCKKLKESTKFPFIVSWFFFLTILLQTLLYIITYSNKPSLKLLNKIYYNMITSHLIMSHFLKINMSMHFGNYIIIAVLDVFGCISINLINKNFYYEICSIAIIDIYLFVNGFKTEHMQTKIFSKYIKEKIKTKEFRDIVSGAMISVAQCGMNPEYENMEIIQMNKIFEKTMGFTIIKTNLPKPNKSKQSQNLMIQSATTAMNNNDNSHRNHQCINLNLSQNLLLNHINNKSFLFSSNLSYNNENNITGCINNNNNVNNNANIEIDTLSSDILYQKGYDKQKSTTKKIAKGLKEVIINYISLGIENYYYYYLGKFKCMTNKSLYSIYIKIKHKSSEGNVFNLIFIELTNNRYEEKEKMETIYQGLIISKISNEFKEGIRSIINTVNIIKSHSASITHNNKNIDQLPLNKYNSSSSIFAPNGIITISLDMLNRITVLSECILVIIANLVDCVKIQGKGSNLLYNKNNNSEGYFNFSDLKIFLEEVVRFYIYLYHKKFNVKYEIEEAFFDLKILTNEIKLKQIVSNLISNAIKHSPNNTDLSIIVNIAGINNNNEDDNEFFNDNESKNTFNYNTMNNNTNNSTCNNAININFNQNITIKLIISDQGPGVPLSVYKKINESSQKMLNRGIKTQKEDQHENTNDSFGKFKEYKMGLAISQKLTKDIGAILSCEYIKGQDITSSIIHGTKFILQLTTPYKRNPSTFQHTVKSPLCNNNKGAIIVSKSFKNQLYKKKNKRISKQANNTDDSHESVYFSDEYVSCMSQDEDYDIKSGFSGNYLCPHQGINSHIVLKNSNYHSIKNSSNYSKNNNNNLDKGKAVNKTPLLSKKNFIFISPVIPEKRTSKSPYMETKNLPIFSLYRKCTMEPPGLDKLRNNYSRIDYNFLNSAKEQSIRLSQQSNTLFKMDISNKSLPFMLNNNDLKIMIVDDSVAYRTNIDIMIRKLCQSKNTLCSIVKYSDGADALYELKKELKIYDHIVTKIIFCGEQMKFVNGSQLFEVIGHSSIKIPSLRIPFVLYCTDAQQPKNKLNEMGLEFVFERVLKKEDIENIFYLKGIWPCKTMLI